MEKEIAQVLDSEAQLEKLMNCIINEINNDDEPFDKRCRHLLLVYQKEPEIADELLISLCGWSMKSLLRINNS